MPSNLTGNLLRNTFFLYALSDLCPLRNFLSGFVKTCLVVFEMSHMKRTEVNIQPQWKKKKLTVSKIFSLHLTRLIFDSAYHSHTHFITRSQRAHMFIFKLYNFCFPDVLWSQSLPGICWLSVGWRWWCRERKRGWWSLCQTRRTRPTHRKRRKTGQRSRLWRQQWGRNVRYVGQIVQCCYCYLPTRIKAGNVMFWQMFWGWLWFCSSERSTNTAGVSGRSPSGFPRCLNYTQRCQCRAVWIRSSTKWLMLMLHEVISHSAGPKW